MTSTFGYNTLPRPRSSALAPVSASLLMVGLAGAAWWWTAREAQTMSSMVQGLAQVGKAMTFDMGTAAFIGMWTAMMVAMMVASVAPMGLALSKGRNTLAGASSSAAFLAGYFVIWAMTSVLALIALGGLSEISQASAWLDRAGGAILVVAGAYQFTPWKQMAVRAYQVSLRALVRGPDGRGPAAAARTGLHEGLCCLGCCWALIAVLFAVGVMSLVWMAAIAIVCLAEKNWRHGPDLTALVGVTLIGLGLAILIHPPFLAALAPSA